MRDFENRPHSVRTMVGSVLDDLISMCVLHDASIEEVALRRAKLEIELDHETAKLDLALQQSNFGKRQ